MTQYPDSFAVLKSIWRAVLAQPVMLLATAVPLITISCCCLKPLLLVFLLCHVALPYHPTGPNRKLKKNNPDEQQKSPTLASPSKTVFWPSNLLPQYQVPQDTSRFCTAGTELVAPIQILARPPPAPLPKQRI